MASVTPNEGQEWISQKIVGDLPDERAYVVAVGDGTGAVGTTDTSLQNELYRSNDDNSNCAVDTTNDTGEYFGRITVTGGLNIPAGSEITEFGLFTTDGQMLYHETSSSGTVIESGENRTFQFTNNVASE